MKAIGGYLYCVAMENGALCLWSMAKNRADSWRNFKRGCVSFKDMTVEEARKKVQAEGSRCVRLWVGEAISDKETTVTDGDMDAYYGD